MIQSYYIFTTGLRGHHPCHSIRRMFHFVLQRRNIRLGLKIARKKLLRLPREKVYVIFYSGLSLNCSYSQKYIPGYEIFQILRTSFLESRFFEDVFVHALDWNHFLDVSLKSFLPLLQRFSHRQRAVSWSSMFHLFMN